MKRIGYDGSTGSSTPLACLLAAMKYPGVILAATCIFSLIGTSCSFLHASGLAGVHRAKHGATRAATSTSVDRLRRGSCSPRLAATTTTAGADDDVLLTFRPSGTEVSKCHRYCSWQALRDFRVTPSFVLVIYRVRCAAFIARTRAVGVAAAVLVARSSCDVLVPTSAQHDSAHGGKANRGTKRVPVDIRTICTLAAAAVSPLTCVTITSTTAVLVLVLVAYLWSVRPYCCTTRYLVS